MKNKLAEQKTYKRTGTVVILKIFEMSKVILSCVFDIKFFSLIQN